MRAAAAMNLLRALATISSMTLLSRVLGLARDFFIARVFGAGLATDAFFVAFRIPNLLRRLFAEGAFSQAFVPILGEYRNRQTPEETRELVDCVASVLFVALVVAAALGVARRAADRLRHGPGVCRRCGQVRAHGGDAAHHFPVHPVHLAGGARRRHPKHLEPVRHSRLSRRCC